MSGLEKVRGIHLSMTYVNVKKEKVWIKICNLHKNSSPLEMYYWTSLEIKFTFLFNVYHRVNYLIAS